jgi:hypothetical protein
VSDGASADLCSEGGWECSIGSGWGEKGTTEHNAFERLNTAAIRGGGYSYTCMIKSTEQCEIFEELIATHSTKMWNKRTV